MAEFTKEMKREGFTILGPNMAPIHFKLIQNLFSEYGYHLELLAKGGQTVVDEGLKYVHNDTCYPALLVIGQMMEALHSGAYDVNKVALILTQTGGGCRASNYIHLLRKALEKDGLGHIPVISLNMAGLEENSGFKVTVAMLRKGLATLIYGDLLMLLSNQTRPYEVKKGETDTLIETWAARLNELFAARKGYSERAQKKYLARIAEDFAKIECDRSVPKVKVGIVGEIYVKYSPVGNNGLEEFLARQDCEVMIPGIVPFFMAGVDHRTEDTDLYGGSKLVKGGVNVLMNYLCKMENNMLEAARRTGRFVVPSNYREMKEGTRGIIGLGCKMGEGWLLTGEMAELIRLGYPNIVCAQPFGCLPNHIVGKGMIRKLKGMFPASNIVPIDYDPGATRVNQENRIKLMLAVAAEMSGTEASEMPVWAETGTKSFAEADLPEETEEVLAEAAAAAEEDRQ